MTRSTEGFWINKPVEAVRNKRLNDFAWDIISRAMRAGLDENLAENLGVFVRQLIDAREFIKDEKAEREFCDNLGELAGLLVNLRRRIQDAEKMLAAAIAGNNALEMMIADTEKYYLDELRRHQDAYDYCREQARQLGNDLPIKIFDPMSFSDLPPLADLPRPFGFSVSENSRLPHPKRQYRLKLVSAIENMALQRGLWPELASELVLVVQDYFVGKEQTIMLSRLHGLIRFFKRLQVSITELEVLRGQAETRKSQLEKALDEREDGLAQLEERAKDVLDFMANKVRGLEDEALRAKARAIAWARKRYKG